MLFLAPAIAFADNGVDLSLAAESPGPVSALDAFPASIATAAVSPAADVTAVNDEQGLIVTLAPDKQPATLDVEAVEAERKYWIGLDCEPADDTLRSQLGLAPEAGLVILEVVDESPAKLSGLQVHDVITVAKFGDKSQNLSSLAQISELIQTAAAQPIELSIVRAGKPATISVTPALQSELMAVKLEVGDKPVVEDGQRRRGRAARRGGPSARNADDRQGRGTRQAARGQGGRRQQHVGRGNRAENHRRGWIGEQRGGRHPRHAAAGRPGRHQFGRFAQMHRRPGGMQAQRGRMAFHRHGRFSGFAFGGPRHGRHFGNQFAMHQRGWGHFGMGQNRFAGRGPGHFQRPVSNERSTTDMTSRLEAVVSRLEALVGSRGLGQMAGRPGAAGFGPGGFRPPAMAHGHPGDGRHESPGMRPQSGGRRDAPRNDSGVEHRPLAHMQQQIKALREQQENINQALRELSEALEKSQRE